jgi:hypothetical protein
LPNDDFFYFSFERGDFFKKCVKFFFGQGEMVYM